MSSRNAFQISKTGDAKLSAQGYPKIGPTFVSINELNFIANINDELIENMMGTYIMYYKIDARRTEYNDLYDEAVIKTFDKPFILYGRISFEGTDVTTGQFTIDKNQTIEAFFHSRKLKEEGVVLREGDFFEWGNSKRLFEIYRVTSPVFIAGFREDDKGGPIGTHVYAKLAREDLFDGR